MALLSAHGLTERLVAIEAHDARRHDRRVRECCCAFLVPPVEVRAHTRMVASWRPVEPTWITPSRSELADLHVLAFHAYRESASGCEVRRSGRPPRGFAAVGMGPSPSARTSQLGELAKAELWAAVDVNTGDVPLRSLCVPFAPAVATNPEWARAVEETLRWHMLARVIEHDGHRGWWEGYGVMLEPRSGRLRDVGESDGYPLVLVDRPLAVHDPAVSLVPWARHASDSSHGALLCEPPVSGGSPGQAGL